MIIVVIGIYIGTIVISEIRCFSLVAKIKKNLEKQNFSLGKNITYEIKNNICSSLDFFIFGYNLHKINSFTKDYNKNYERCKIKLLYDKKIVHRGSYIHSNLIGHESNQQNHIKKSSIDIIENNHKQTREELIQQRKKLLQILVNPVESTYMEEQDGLEARKR